MIEKDTYKTIEKPSEEVLYKAKNSKFFGYALPVSNEDDVKSHLSELKKKHHAARHWCYAYQLGVENHQFRANDDGEPNNSAGMPIYGQIQSFGVTNILIVVVRYFGGVKLGVSGLISAYKTTAQLTLQHTKILKKTINIKYLISFDYKNMNTVMRMIKEKKLTVVEQKMGLGCQIKISVRKKDADMVYKTFKKIFEVTIETV